MSPGDGGGFELYDLHSAAKQDDIPAVIRLLKEGALIDKRDPYGYTPLHWACQKGYTRIVQALLAAGANANVRDKWRRTPLHRAAKEGHKDVVAALIEGGAEINAQGDSNWTPLHCSSFHGQLEIVEMLLRYGADQSVKDMRGRTCAVVCEMGLYDVDQEACVGTTDYRQRMVTSFLDVEGVDDCLHMVFAVRNEDIKNKIKHLLETAPPLLQRMMVDTRASAGNGAPLKFSPSASPSPSTQSAMTAFDRSLTTAEDAAEAAAKAAGVAAGVCNTPPSPATAEAIAAASASTANAFMAAELGVFAMWDKIDGQGGSFGPGLLSPDNGGDDGADAEDALWREMWVALHVPDPDNPDNDLYSEVKTLRKDVKRLRSDLSNDAGNYEGIFGGDSVSTPGGNPVGESVVGSHSPAAASAATTPPTTTTATTADAAGESSSSAVAVDTGSVLAAASEVILPPPAKRQRSHDESEVSIINNNNNNNGNGVVVPEATNTLSPNGVVGGVAAGDEERIAAMTEAELREELRLKNQLTAELAREVNALRRRIEAIIAAEAAAGVAWEESGFGTPSVLDEESRVKKVG